MLRQNVSALDYTARHQDALDTPRAIQRYFNELSDLRGPDAVDKHGILDAFLRGIRGCQFPFAQVAEEFRLIENAARTVYLPVGEGSALCEQLRSGHVTRTLLRKLGVYSVSCYKDQFDKLDAAGALELRPDGSAILTDTDIRDGVRIALDCNRVWVDEQEADLTETEYKILKLLMQSPQRIFPVQVIYETVWGEPYFYVSNGTVMVHIRNLRMAEPPHCDKQALLSERYYRCV